VHIAAKGHRIEPDMERRDVMLAVGNALYYGLASA
jgi:hypothetical protein